MRTWVQRIRAITPWIAPVIGVALAPGVGASLRAAGQRQAAPATQPAAAQDRASRGPQTQAPAGQPAGTQDKAQEVLAQLRAAMGGDKAAAIKSLSAEGSTRMSVGDREMTMDVQIKTVLPDHFQRISQPEMPNGMPGPRFAQTLNGTEAWTGSLDPMPNFGGGPGGGGGGGRREGGGREGGGRAGGGMIFMGGGAFTGGPGGADGPAATARVRADLLRSALGIFAGSDALQGVTYSYVGTAQSKDGGEADVLAVKAEGLDAKLFIDKKTHLPLMLTYMAPDVTRIMRRGPGGGPGGGANGAPNGAAAPGSQSGAAQAGSGAAPADPNETPEAREKRIAEERQKRMEEIRKQIENAPQVENQLFYADYKNVNGVMLPHRFTRSVNGNPADETEISKYKINPKIDLKDFQKKGN
jgi:hypothetical protein